MSAIKKEVKAIKSMKGGRPRIEDKREFRLELKLNKTEKEALDQMFSESKKVYRYKNEMLRDIIFNKKYRVMNQNFDHLEVAKVNSSINKIGNNLNQFVKKVNQNKDELKNISELKNVLLEIIKLHPEMKHIEKLLDL